MKITIDATPTWRGIAPALVAILRDGDAQAQNDAMAELLRMADIADEYVAMMKKAKETVTGQ